MSPSRLFRFQLPSRLITAADITLKGENDYTSQTTVYEVRPGPREVSQISRIGSKDDKDCYLSWLCGYSAAKPLLMKLRSRSTAGRGMRIEQAVCCRSNQHLDVVLVHWHHFLEYLLPNDGVCLKSETYCRFSTRECWHQASQEEQDRLGKYCVPGPQNGNWHDTRKDIQHKVFELLMGGDLGWAPLSPGPKNVLDIGTGTGIWAIKYARKNPSSTIVGSDLSLSEYHDSYNG